MEAAWGGRGQPTTDEPNAQAVSGAKSANALYGIPMRIIMGDTQPTIFRRANMRALAKKRPDYMSVLCDRLDVRLASEKAESSACSPSPVKRTVSCSTSPAFPTI